jgi:hypothetical protein
MISCITRYNSPRYVRDKCQRRGGAFGARLSQTEAARQLGISEPKVSSLSNYRLDGFSVERLMHFLTALDQDG